MTTPFRKKVNEDRRKKADEIHLAAITTPVAIVQTFTDCEYRVAAGILPTAVTHSYYKVNPLFASKYDKWAEPGKYQVPLL